MTLTRVIFSVTIEEMEHKNYVHLVNYAKKQKYPSLEYYRVWHSRIVITDKDDDQIIYKKNDKIIESLPVILIDGVGEIKGTPPIYRDISLSIRGPLVEPHVGKYKETVAGLADILSNAQGLYEIVSNL